MPSVFVHQDFESKALKQQYIKFVGALGLMVFVSACASTFNLPKTTKSGSINKEIYAKMRGPASLNGIITYPYGLPIYGSLSIYRGSKPWKSDPKTEIARAESGNIEMRIRADSASTESVAVAQQFAADFTKAFSEVDAKVWKNQRERVLDVELLMFAPGTKINRQYKRVFFGKTFHTKFYFPFYTSDKSKNVGQMHGFASTSAHELYHLRVSRLGGGNTKPYRKDLTKAQKYLLEEAAGRFLGACVELKVKKVIWIGRGVVFSKRDPDTGQVRVGTLSDNMIRAALKPGAKIAPDDLVPLGPMLFATYWAEHTGAKALIHAGDDAAKQMQAVCDTYIANPTWLWPVFWQMAADGVDAPDFRNLMKKTTKK